MAVRKGQLSEKAKAEAAAVRALEANAPGKWLGVRTNTATQDALRAHEFRKWVDSIRSGNKVRLAALPVRQKTHTTGIKLLVIGDSHADPDEPNWRYDALGRFIVDHKPSIVVDIGDWWSFNSLASQAKGYENERYWRDVEAGVDAMARVNHQIDDYNKGSKRPYKPRKVRTLGNHEDRIDRCVADLPHQLAGIMGVHDLMSAEFGWEEHPFLEPVLIQNVSFAHYFVSGTLSRPIGGETPAYTLMRKGLGSAVQGHDHLLDFCDRWSVKGEAIMTAHAGCFFEHDFDWAGKQANRMYRRGLLLLNNLENGSFDPEWWGMDRVMERYG